MQFHLMFIAQSKPVLNRRILSFPSWPHELPVDIKIQNLYYRNSITNINIRMKHRELYSGLIRIHILYHANKEPLYGLWLIEELGRHGYKISPGTLYPILHNMEKRGYLTSRKKLHGGKYRRVYRITEEGRSALKAANLKVRELFRELIEEK